MCRHFLYGVNWLHFENFIPFSSVRLSHKIPNSHTRQAKSTKKSEAFGLFLRPNLLWTLIPYCKRNNDQSNKNNVGSFKFPTFITWTWSKMCLSTFRLSRLKRLCHSCLDHFADKANYAFLMRCGHQRSGRKRQNNSFLSNKYTFQGIIQNFTNTKSELWKTIRLTRQLTSLTMSTRFCPFVPSFVFAVLLIPSLNVLSDFFFSIWWRFLCLNIDKSRDTAPLMAR